MDEKELAEIRERAEAATPERLWPKEADAVLFAHAREDVLRLLDALDEERARNKLFADCLLRASRLTASRDESGELHFLDGAESLARLLDEVERLRAALDAVEWVEMPLIGGIVDPYSICPWCGGTYGNGHSPDCLRQRALKGGE